jgi:hypothetical protein
MSNERSFYIEGFLFGEKYQARAQASFNGLLEFLNCVHCGRDTSKQGNSLGVYVSGGGGLIIHPDDYETYPHNGGDMGWFPVGSECIKKVPAEFRVENPYDNKVWGV